MKIAFHKYQGAGNDFVLIDNRNKKTKLNQKQIAVMCDRHFGIGADGLMLLELQKGCDFKMVYYNSDGNESTMCGNGGRCITMFAKHLGIIKKKAVFLAIDGMHQATVKKDQVKLGMTDPKNFTKIGNDHTVNTGSPHYISFVKDVKNMDVYKHGYDIRNNKTFKKEGINVNFVEELKKGELFVRTFERGVEDETLSCGTGVTAAAIVYADLNNIKNSCSIKTLGDNLIVYFEKNKTGFTNVYLEGPAEYVYKGTIDL